MFFATVIILCVAYACYKYFIFQTKLSDSDSATSILKTKKDELETSSNQWKSRVEKSDAEKFTVAGQMRIKGDREGAASPIRILGTDEVGGKRTPVPKRFKGKEG